MVTKKRGSSRLRGRARQAGKCGFRAVARRQTNRREVAPQRRGPGRGAGFPGPAGPFPGSTRIGEAAEARPKRSSFCGPGSEASGGRGKEGGGEVTASSARSLLRFENLLTRGPPQPGPSRARRRDNDAEVGAGPGGTGCPRDARSGRAGVPAGAGRPLQLLRGSCIPWELNRHPVSRGRPDPPSGFRTQRVDCPGTTFSTPELGLGTEL